MTTERIEINPAIMMGKPVIRGTRITVELILRTLAEGASEAELLEDYTQLTTEDIRALREAGYDVVAIAEVAKGATDEQVLERSLTEKRVLITEDRDFGDVVCVRA